MKEFIKRPALYLKIIACSFIVLLLSDSGLFAQPFKLFSVSDLVRVFEDGYKFISE